MREVIGFVVIVLCVGGLMLLGELLHRIFRAAKLPLRPRSHALSELWHQSGETRYSIRHLERYVLIAFVCVMSFLFLPSDRDVLESYFSLESLPLMIIIIAVVGIWWSFRKGALR